jgi:hypothetical protein
MVKANNPRQARTRSGSDVLTVIRSYITQEDLAQLLHVSKRTLQNRLSAHPDSLPTPIRFPGAKAPLWDPAAVAAWQDAIAASGSVYARSNLSIIVAPSQAEKRRRGRPSNAERAARGELGGRV